MSTFLLILLIAALGGGAIIAALFATVVRWVGMALAAVALAWALAWGARALFGPTGGAWVMMVITGLLMVLGWIGQAMEYRERRSLKASMDAAFARYDAERYALELEQFGQLDADIMRAERVRWRSMDSDTCP